MRDSRPIIPLLIPNVSSLGRELHNQAELIRYSWRDIAIVEGIYTWIPWLSRYPTFDYNPKNSRHQNAIANWASQMIGVDPVTGNTYRNTGKDVKGNDQPLTIPTVSALKKVAKVQATLASSSDWVKLATIHGLLDQDGRVSAYTGKPKEKEIVANWVSQIPIPGYHEIGLDVGQTDHFTPEDRDLAKELFEPDENRTDRYEFDEKGNRKLSAIQIQFGFVTKEDLKRALLVEDVEGVWTDLVERGILVERIGEGGKVIGGVIQQSFMELQSSSGFELSAQYDSIKEKVWKTLVQSQRIFTFDRNGNLTRIQRKSVLVIPDEKALGEEIDTYYTLITDVRPDPNGNGTIKIWDKIAVIWGFAAVTKADFEKLGLDINVDDLLKELIKNGYLQEVAGEYRIQHNFVQLKDASQLQLSTVFADARVKVFGLLLHSLDYTASDEQREAIATLVSSIFRDYRTMGEAQFFKNEELVTEEVFLEVRNEGDLLVVIDQQYEFLHTEFLEIRVWSDIAPGGKGFEDFRNLDGTVKPYDGKNIRHRIFLAQFISSDLFGKTKFEVTPQIRAKMEQLGLQEKDLHKTANEIRLSFSQEKRNMNVQLDAFLRKYMDGKMTPMPQIPARPIRLWEALLLNAGGEEPPAAPAKGQKRPAKPQPAAPGRLRDIFAPAPGALGVRQGAIANVAAAPNWQPQADDKNDHHPDDPVQQELKERLKELLKDFGSKLLDKPNPH